MARFPTPTVQVSISWVEKREGSVARCRIEWTEEDGPPIVPPSGSGFGSRLIERALSENLHPTVAVTYPHTGLDCVIEFDLADPELEATL